MRNPLLSLLGCATLLGLGGCGGTGDLADAIGAGLSDFIVVDLATGTVSSRVAISDLLTNPTYKDRYLVFRSVATGTGVIGSEVSGFGAQVDETRGSASNSRFFLAVFELTQAQWTRIAGTSPWTSSPSSLTGVADGSKAAMCLSWDLIEPVLSTAGGVGYGYRLPAAVEWELACRAGSTATFSWGESRDDVTVSTHAVVAETATGVSGPRVVGTKAANAFGFYDMHGNVWEMTSDGDIRGGSWRDSLPSARCANMVAVDRIVEHPLVGIRLVLELQ